MNIIIVGGGQVGSYVANLLLNDNHKVKIIDHRMPIINKLKKELPEDSIIFGNGTDPDVLEKAGILRTDVFLAVTGADETNLVASTLAKYEFGVPQTVGRVNNPKNAWLFTYTNGVDISVNQADILGHMVIEEMNMKNMFTLMKLFMGNYSIIQIHVAQGSKAVGNTVASLGIPDGAKLILIKHNEEVSLPGGDTIIRANDIVIALAGAEEQKVLHQLFD